MGPFLREHWLWIVAPLALVVLLVALVIVLGGSGVGEFEYEIF